MNRRRATVLVFVSLGLVCILVLLPGSRKPVARLKIVRFAVEQGKSVVYFRVEAGTNRLLTLTPFLQKLEGGRVEEWLVMGTNGLIAKSADFLASSQSSDPWVNESTSREEFGILAPTNSPVWRLRIQVNIEDPYSIRRLAVLLKMGIKIQLPPVRSFPAAAAALWKHTAFHYEILESDPITNVVTPEAFSRAMR